MVPSKYYIIFFMLCFIISAPKAQNLGGRWEGIMSDEFLQVNIAVDKAGLCGYTYDYVLLNKGDYCKAYFKGYYDAYAEAWIIEGIRFIENSGTHDLMSLKLWHEPGAGSNKLQATVSIKSFFDLAGTLGDTVNLELTRVSEIPAPLPGSMPLCFGKKTTVSLPLNEKPLQNNPAVSIAVRVDTFKRQSVNKPMINQADPDSMQQNFTARKNIVIGRFPIGIKNITLNVYDNAIVDGDTVSIFYNGKLLINKQRLSEKPITLNLELDEASTRQEIILFAHNLGSIPPNTALIVVTAGTKRYELHASANLEENAVLVFEYVPK
jgi:hypothetical protein